MDSIQSKDLKLLSQTYHDGLLNGIERDTENKSLTLMVRDHKHREAKIILKGVDYAVLDRFDSSWMIISEILIYSGESAAELLKNETKLKKEIHPEHSEVDNQYKENAKRRYDSVVERILDGELLYVDFWGTQFGGFAVCGEIEEIILS